MSKKLQLFILPFAGGDSNSFNRLLSMLDDEIESVVIEYAGRLSRRKEGYIQDYQVFLNDVASQINAKRKKNLPYSLFGYSLGSVILYDLVINGLIDGNPKHVFICSKGSLHNKSKVDHEDGYSDEEVVDEIRYLGGTDERILNNPRFLTIFMEPVKMDFNIWRQFTYHPGVINCDATFMYSIHDPAAAGVHDWDKNINGKTEYIELGKNHFFIKEHWSFVAKVVNDNLKQYL